MDTLNSSIIISDTLDIATCSQHSLLRAKQRAGLKQKRTDKLIKHAMERGKRYSDCSRHIDQIYLKYTGDETTEAIAYNGFCFIFDKKLTYVSPYILYLRTLAK